MSNPLLATPPRHQPKKIKGLINHLLIGLKCILANNILKQVFVSHAGTSSSTCKKNNKNLSNNSHSHNLNNELLIFVVLIETCN